MSLPVVITYGSGETLSVGVQQIDSTGLGDVWDFNTEDWETSGTFADTTDAMTEDGTSGVYSYVLPTLGTFSGTGLVKIYDTSSEVVVYAIETQLINGDAAQSVISPVLVARARTFLMQESVEGAKAANVVALATDKTITISFDFTRVLNPKTGISTGTATVVTGSNVTLSNVRVAQDRQSLHADVIKTSAGNATLRATITTTDGQELSGDGIITAA